MSNWLKNILDDVEQKAAARPEWEKSEYAQVEIARLRTMTHATTVSSVAPQAKAAKGSGKSSF